jgi:hypothetical protein
MKRTIIEGTAVAAGSGESGPAVPEAARRPQRQDLPRRRGDRFQPRRPAPAVAGRGQPGAHVRLRLRDVDPGDSLVAELVLLVFH